MRRVVITGATSMIGTALISECIQNNVEVLAITRKCSIHQDRLPQSDLIQITECDLNDLSTFMIEEKNYDVFYHLAWEHTAKKDRDNPLLQEKNIQYTLNAVKLANQLGCHKFIGAGSQAEYGNIDHVITPTTAVSPLIAYGIAKYTAGRLSEKLCKQYGMLCIWARIFSVYGQYDNEGTMLNYAIDKFLKGEPAYFSAATQMWDYLHESDAGKMLFLLGKKATESKVYCIASGESRPLKDFILIVANMFGKRAVYEFANDKEMETTISLQADISELVRDIGYIPQISFKEGVSEMVSYRRKLMSL